MAIEKDKDEKIASEHEAQTDRPIKNKIDKKKKDDPEPPIKSPLNDHKENLASEVNGLNEQNLDTNEALLKGDE